MVARLILFVVLVAGMLETSALVRNAPQVLTCRVKLLQPTHHIFIPHIGLQSLSSAAAISRTQLHVMGRTVVNEPKRRKGILLDDFNQILEAIAIHKEVFGDTRIIDSYEVPAEDPWPQSLHGLRLGKRLARIITAPTFETDHPEKVAALRKAGFQPVMSSFSDEWSVLVEALETYKKVFGDLRINARFVVPSEQPWPPRTHGMRLGVKVAGIRSAGRFVKDNPDRKVQLEELGFKWTLQSKTPPSDEDDEFNDVMEALRLYKKHVSDRFLIPNTWKVPAADPWPKHMHDMKLGMIVKRMRQKGRYIEDRDDRVQALNDIGFVFEDLASRESLAESRFAIIFSSLLQYKELFGTLNVPANFVVPEAQPWPEEAWGFKLGNRLNAIRSQGTFVANSPERRQLLDSIGFSWDIRSRQSTKGTSNDDVSTGEVLEQPGPRRQEFLSSLDQSIRDAESRAASADSVDDAFTRAAKAAAAAGLVDLPDGTNTALSNAAKGLLNRDMPDSMTQELLSRGPFTSYPWFFGDTYREVASEARRDYLRSRDYSEDPDIRQFGHFEGWMQPSKLNRVMNRRISPEARQQMKKVGYRMMDFNEFYWEDVLDALTSYKLAYHDCNVPLTYVITDDVLDLRLGFKEEHLGMRLGQFVRGLQVGDYDGLEDPVRRKELSELDFDWGDKSKYLRFRFLPLFYGLRVFSHLFQLPMPRTNFVVPEEDQWPIWMYNMPLGEWTAAARIQQDLLREEYPDRVDLLNTLEFDWFLPPGPSMPSRYYRPVK